MITNLIKESMPFITEVVILVLTIAAFGSIYKNIIHFILPIEISDHFSSLSNGHYWC